MIVITYSDVSHTAQCPPPDVSTKPKSPDL